MAVEVGSIGIWFKWAMAGSGVGACGCGSGTDTMSSCVLTTGASSSMGVILVGSSSVGRAALYLCVDGATRVPEPEATAELEAEPDGNAGVFNDFVNLGVYASVFE